MTYADLLRDPRWQRKRLEIMQRADFCCELCGDDRTTLNVHHLRYVRGRMPWQYDDTDLACLCEPCHRRQHPEKATPTRVGAIVPSVISALAGRARRAGRYSPQWQRILDRFGVVDRYDERVCVVCWAAWRVDLTRCADCREDVA